MFNLLLGYRIFHYVQFLMQCIKAQNSGFSNPMLPEFAHGLGLPCFQ